MDKPSEPSPLFQPPGSEERERALSAVAGALAEPEEFLAREREGDDAVGTYTLRESGRRLCLRHGSKDLGVFDEVFLRRLYELPAPVTELLDGLGRPLRVADLGAHIGLFGVYISGLLDVSELAAYEPDRFNRPVLECCIQANGFEDSWRVIEAVAGDSAGWVSFEEGESSGSQVSSSGEDDAQVPSVDVLPELDGVDLLKIDAEGGEWPVLRDERFASVGPPAVTLEYHPQPEGAEREPRDEVEELLRAAGYTLEPIFHRADGVGMLWAWRGASTPPA